jgi:hypothetical protein
MSLRKISLATSIIILSLVFFAIPVFADCDGVGTVVCGGDDGSGIILGSGADVLTIQAGVRVSNAAGSGVDARAGNDQVTNDGVVSSQVFGIDGYTGNDTLINNGEILDGEVGMYGNRGNDTITNNGSITAIQHGIEGGRDVDTITNNGFITALVSDGIVGTGVIVNSPTGQIIGGSHGINGSGRILNQGIAQGSVGSGLRGGVGRDLIVNDASGSAIGGQYGINGWDGNDTILNYGYVETGINGWYGNDRIELYGGLVVGIISGGEDNDTLVFAMTVPANEIDALTATLEAANPGEGSIVINGVEIRWSFFEAIEVDLVAG